MRNWVRYSKKRNNSTCIFFNTMCAVLITNKIVHSFVYFRTFWPTICQGATVMKDVGNAANFKAISVIQLCIRWCHMFNNSWSGNLWRRWWPSVNHIALLFAHKNKHWTHWKNKIHFLLCLKVQMTKMVMPIGQQQNNRTVDQMIAWLSYESTNKRTNSRSVTTKFIFLRGNSRLTVDNTEILVRMLISKCILKNLNGIMSITFLNYIPSNTLTSDETSFCQ